MDPVAANKLSIKAGRKCEFGPSNCYMTFLGFGPMLFQPGMSVPPHIYSAMFLALAKLTSKSIVAEFAFSISTANCTNASSAAPIAVSVFT